MEKEELIKEEAVQKIEQSRQNEIVLECKDLCKDFLVGGRLTRVINNISCSFKQGEFVTIMGASGSGKSTLLYLLSGIEHLTSGCITILGKDITKYSQKQISRLRSNDISFVFQSYNLIPTFTVYENITTPLLLGKRKVNEYDVDMILTNVGLSKYKHSPVTMLSGGEQQRVAIARALISNPKILFADEPTGNLDSKNSIEIMKLFTKINEITNTTIIQVTHAREMALYGNRIITLKDGQILSDEKVD